MIITNIILVDLNNNVGENYSLLLLINIIVRDNWFLSTLSYPDWTFFLKIERAPIQSNVEFNFPRNWSNIEYSYIWMKNNYELFKKFKLIKYEEEYKGQIGHATYHNI